MAAPEVIKSSDSGAPVLTGVEGSLVALLDATIVAMAGWTKLFSSTGKAVYQPPLGDRQLYRVDNSAANGVGTIYSVVKCFESMSDIDTGTGLWHTGYVQNASEANTNPVDYILIFDAYGFYIATKTTYAGYPATHYQICYYGDYIPIVSDYSWRSIACDKAWQGGYDERYFACTFGIEGYWRPGYRNNTMHRKPSGAIETLGYQFELSYNATVVTGPVSSPTYQRATGSRAISATYNYPYKGKLLYCSLSIVDSVDNNPIGLMPGAYHPMHPNLTTVQTITTDGKTFLCIPIAIGADPYYWPDTYSVKGAVLIDIGEGFRP